MKQGTWLITYANIVWAAFLLSLIVHVSRDSVEMVDTKHQKSLILPDSQTQKQQTAYLIFSSWDD